MLFFQFWSYNPSADFRQSSTTAPELSILIQHGEENFSAGSLHIPIFLGIAMHPNYHRDTWARDWLQTMGLAYAVLRNYCRWKWKKQNQSGSVNGIKWWVLLMGSTNVNWDLSWAVVLDGKQIWEKYYIPTPQLIEVGCKQWQGYKQDQNFDPVYRSRKFPQMIDQDTLCSLKALPRCLVPWAYL